jgi:hypothetical protein
LGFCAYDLPAPRSQAPTQSLFQIREVPRNTSFEGFAFDGAPLLTDPVRSVCNEAARLLAGAPSDLMQGEQEDSA